MAGWVVGCVGVGWVAGLNENITNSAKLGLTEAEFGNIEEYVRDFSETC